MPPELLTNGDSSAGTRVAGAIVCDAYLRMLFEHNFTHGDMHPGNILIRGLDEQGGRPLSAQAGGELSPRPDCRPKGGGHWHHAAGRRHRDRAGEPGLGQFQGPVWRHRPARLARRGAAHPRAVATPPMHAAGAVCGWHRGAAACGGTIRPRAADGAGGRRGLSTRRSRPACGWRRSRSGSCFPGCCSWSAPRAGCGCGVRLTARRQACEHRVRLETNFTSIAASILVVEALGRTLNPQQDILRAALPFLVKEHFRPTR